MKRMLRKKNAVEMVHDAVDSATTAVGQESDESIFGDLDDYDFYNDSPWELVDRKDVLDFDGFYTKYSLYHNIRTHEWVTVFGDPDIYRPEDGESDAEFDNESEAREFFDSYQEDELI